MNNDLISVIVPIYNVQKYLSKCIDSIINQIYNNIEIILIDDGSTDECGKICEQYAKKDKRIKVFHENNKGVSAARNKGIQNSTGNYIMFVDADDFIDLDMIKKLYIAIKEENADIVICGTKDVDERGNIISKSKENEKVILTNIEALKYMLNEEPYNSVCWGKIYRKELFNKYKFNTNIKIAEDLEILYKIFFDSNKIVYLPDRMYNWLVRYNSVTKEKFNDDWKKEIYICEEIIQFTKKNCKQIEDYAIKRFIRINVSCLIKALKNNTEVEEIKILKRNITKYKIKNKKVFSLKYRLKIFIVLNFTNILKYII